MVKKFTKIKNSTAYLSEIAEVVLQEVSFEGIEANITYEFIRRPNVAIIVPITKTGKLIFTSQYRASAEKFIWEFPAGHVKKGENINEAALRELEEETGKKSDNIKLIYEFDIAPHYCDEKAYVFIAKDLRPGMFNPEHKEIIYSHELSLEEVNNKILTGEITDAKTLISYQAYLGNIKNEIL